MSLLIKRPDFEFIVTYTVNALHIAQADVTTAQGIGVDGLVDHGSVDFDRDQATCFEYSNPVVAVIAFVGSAVLGGQLVGTWIFAHAIRVLLASLNQAGLLVSAPVRDCVVL